MKFTPGPAIASASGSIGGTTFSRNRYGAYTRNRAIPVNPQTANQLAVRARLSNLSTAWGGLTVAQRLSWSEWARQNPIVDTLGQTQVLAGNAAYIQLNSRILAASAPAIDSPPIVTAPDSLLSITLDGDIGLGNFEIAFTPTPLGATESIWTMTAVTNSTGITYVTNLLRQVTISPVAQVSPLDNQIDIEARFGPLVVGQTVHQWVSVFDEDTGLLSAPLRASIVVTTT